jgi:hypothetical protein
MQDPVKTITGIGEKTAQLLQSANVHTVGELAKVQPFGLGITIPNLGALISRAKIHIAKQTEPKNLVVVTNNGIRIEEIKETKETTLKQERTLISNHPWFEKLVIIPSFECSEKMIEVVIYELCLDPYERVSMLCGWNSDPESDDLCTMTYSPQFIFHYNSHLPRLTCSIDPDDWGSMNNKHVLQNVLWETNAMRRDITETKGTSV